MGVFDVFETFVGNDTDNISDIPSFVLNEVQEFAPSMEVQAAEIRDVFFDIPELQYDNWVELSNDEKIDALARLENEVAEIAHRPAVSVEYADLGPGVLGDCNGQRIRVATSRLEDNSYQGYKELLNTLFHEGRHAYQDYNVFVKQVEQNSELVSSWSVNNQILGYDNGERSNSDLAILGYFEYYSQPVEVDARVFAETVINAIGI